MEIQLTRDSIIGTGTIKHHNKANEKLKGGASVSGYVDKLRSGVAGKVYEVTDAIADRLIGLGSAILASEAQQQQKAR
jgi:hypothetical protein